MILTQEYSRVANIYGSENRAWLISPQGEIHPCEDNHDVYVFTHQEEFGGVLSSYPLIKDGWIRVGLLIDRLYIESDHRLTVVMLTLLQGFAKNISNRFRKVEIHIDDITSSYFDQEDFLIATLKDINRRGVSHYASRVANSTTRAWMISPQGKVHDCGDGEHSDYVMDHMEEFDGHDMYYLREEGWIQVGVFDNNNFYFESLDLLSHTNLSIIQELARQTQVPYSKVEVHVGETGMKTFTKEWFQLITVKDVNRRGPSHYGSKQAALPHSRSLLRHTDLEGLSYPLRKAFSLLGLEDQYRDMSLNQISSALRKHEILLEDETGWTSDELIRDLNQILE